MMWNTGLGGGMGSGWIGMLLVLFFGTMILVGFLLIVVWAIRAATSGGGHGHPTAPPATGTGADPAEQTARERYARGEISQEELNEILRVLRGG